MPTLIYCDHSGHQSAQREGAAMADRLTDLVAQYAALDLPNAAPVATADLPALIADAPAWVVARLLGNGAFTLGGLTVHPEKVLDLVQHPPGLDAFIAAAQEAGRYLTGPGMSYELRSAASYTVGAGGQVRVSATAAQTMEARFSRFTATAAQDKLLADLTAVCTVLNRLRTGALSGGNLLGGEGMLDKALIVPMHGSTDPVRPNPDFILANAR